MSDYAVLFILFVLAVLSYIVYVLLSNPIKPPKVSTFNLPPKIYFEQTADNNYGVGSFMLDVVTIGGHGRLKESRFNYEKSYTRYANHFNTSVDLQDAINHKLNAVGAITYSILKELDASRKLLNKPAKSGSGHNIAVTVNALSHRVNHLRQIADAKGNTGHALIQGSTVGGLAAVGSWTLVSMFGSASTGTAIASLSGVAAQNSILAWFGGGALAAGGGGMAAGALTLGAIVAAPIVIFSSYKTHSSASDLNVKTSHIEEQSSRLRVSNHELAQADKVIVQQLQVLKVQHDKLVRANKQIREIIYPNGLSSKAKRSLNRLMNQDFYTKEEFEGLERLLRAINEIYETFDSQSTPSKSGNSMGKLR